MKNKILILDKEGGKKFKELFVYNENVEVYCLKTVQEALWNLTLWNYHLIIIESMKDIDFICRIIDTIRKFKKIPILILTYGGIENKKICIQAGADVVLLYPYNNDEIELYSLSLIRRYTQWKEEINSDSRNVSFESLTIDYLTRKVYWKQNRLNLTSHEFDFIKLLSSMPGRVYTFEQIYQIVWNEQCHGDIRNIIWCTARRLRKKLRKEEPEAGNIIRSARNVGYYFEPNEKN